MKPSSTWSIAAAAFVLGFSIATSASTQQAAKPPVKPTTGGSVPAVVLKSVGDMTATDEEEFSKVTEEMIERVCINCHPFENITKTRRTVKEWSDQVSTMAMRGAPGSEPEFAAIKKYLTRYYGIVRVNTATAEELTSVLGLSAKDANAIVEYRKANGNFTDAASLEKVEGIDKAKIEEQPESLRFS